MCIRDRAWPARSPTSATWRSGWGDHERASRLFQESLRLFWDLGDRASSSVCMTGLAAVAQAQHRRAVQVLAAAAAMRADSSAALSSADRAREERLRAELRTALGREAFAASWVVGQALSLE